MLCVLYISLQILTFHELKSPRRRKRSPRSVIIIYSCLKGSMLDSAVIQKIFIIKTIVSTIV